MEIIQIKLTKLKYLKFRVNLFGRKLGQVHIYIIIHNYISNRIK